MMTTSPPPQPYPRTLTPNPQPRTHPTLCRCVCRLVDSLTIVILTLRPPGGDSSSTSHLLQQDWPVWLMYVSQKCLFNKLLKQLISQVHVKIFKQFCCFSTVFFIPIQRPWFWNLRECWRQYPLQVRATLTTDLLNINVYSCLLHYFFMATVKVHNPKTELKVFKDKVDWSVGLGENKTRLFQRGNDKQLYVSSLIMQ